MENTKKNIDIYAEMIIKNGLNQKDNENVFINCSSETMYFAEIIKNKIENNYKNSGVMIMKYDMDSDFMKKYKNRDNFYSKYPDEIVIKITDFIKDRGSIINIYNPVIKTISQKSSVLWNKINAVYSEKIGSKMFNSEIKWTTFSVATDEWAKRLFKNDDTETAYNKLWDIIFRSNGMDEGYEKFLKDKKHKIQKTCDFLNKSSFEYILIDSPGSYLEIKLPEGYLWKSSFQKVNQNESFTANFPSYEVFTTPDFRNINGVIKTTKPVIFNGEEIPSSRFIIENGEIKKFESKNKKLLGELFSIDKGSSRFGEIALVSCEDMPVNLKDFKNNLYNENISSHFAFGNAYTFTFISEKFSTFQNGVNKSSVHIDFPFGEKNLNIYGINSKDEKISLIENNKWSGIVKEVQK